AHPMRKVFRVLPNRNEPLASPSRASPLSVQTKCKHVTVSSTVRPEPRQPFTLVGKPHHNRLTAAHSSVHREGTELDQLQRTNHPIGRKSSNRGSTERDDLKQVP